ncbi:MAG: hypothetical protein AUH72_08220 [Acidobacteria bacterium 13_1_40CM_4_65_8]|nr:MAG: hypothetical protein AUH72_08220 [Acidobacteria bacterium 13_1_40CM_4_65_8]
MPGRACRRAIVTAVCGWILLSVQPSLAFKPRYHGDFTRQVLGDITRTIEGHTLRFTARAIEQIITNNQNQDDGWCLVGSPSPPFSVSANHFDGEDLSGGSSRRPAPTAKARAGSWDRRSTACRTTTRTRTARNRPARPTIASA